MGPSLNSGFLFAYSGPNWNSGAADRRTGPSPSPEFLLAHSDRRTKLLAAGRRRRHADDGPHLVTLWGPVGGRHRSWSCTGEPMSGLRGHSDRPARQARSEGCPHRSGFESSNAV